jgi:hypothetical protein
MIELNSIEFYLPTISIFGSSGSFIRIENREIRLCSPRGVRCFVRQEKRIEILCEASCLSWLFVCVLCSVFEGP